MRTRIKSQNKPFFLEQKVDSVFEKIWKYLFLMIVIPAITPIFFIPLVVTFNRYNSIWLTIIVWVFELFLWYKIIRYIIIKEYTLHDFFDFINQKIHSHPKEKERFIFLMFCIFVCFILMIIHPVVFFTCCFTIWVWYYLLGLNRNRLYRIKKFKPYYSYSSQKLITIRNHNNYYKNKKFEKYAEKKIFKDLYYLQYITGMAIISLIYIGIIFLVAFLMDLGYIPENMYTIVPLLLWLPGTMFLHTTFYKKRSKSHIDFFIYEHLPKSTLFYQEAKNIKGNSFIFSHNR